ncbi:DNA repair protein RAD51 homolog 4-like [Asterias rubens]|uniref:DNA repair protein RAD51 homolog 4-like n=1 Tax=Asterias rubens TaxID=7604 RepID=UPI001454E721|nr:DNA repair protein RAD51 homolog 4-like [Asterias rubens]
MSHLRVGLCPALSTETLDALNTAGVRTVVEFVGADFEELSQTCSVSYKTLQSIRRLLLAQNSTLPINGADLYDHVISSVAILSTGCKSVDELLDGGLYTSEVTEVTGVLATGKSQLCLSASASVTLTAQQNVLYIDTTGAYSSHRLQDIMISRESSEKDVAAALQRLRCIRIFDLFDLLSLLERTKTSLASGNDTFYASLKLVVVDSVTAVVGPLLGGQQTDGHVMMMHLARSLKALAVEYSVAILVSNNQVGSEGGERKPALGVSWAHVPHCRIVLTHHRPGDANLQPANQQDTQRVARIIKSGRQETNISCTFKIDETGICN